MTELSAISSTQGVSTDTSRLATKENLDKAGKQFEAVFTGMMLKSMRAAKLAEPLFDSKALDTFKDMQDQKLVQQMAEHTPLGIGKAMTDFLGRSQALASAGSGDSSNVDDSTG
ncbi:rod-binding protein [Sphingomonas rubra]|uniref:Flagellar protein FlgJ n=1 Tax=Sphingomonas rubra TaxID=634430 RepID=A0A1I5UJ18_9SPHN|nr:rod-binding protein [Sphingomonas rubra]SFP95283.1 flagellar protein FlgJ [Sphingomonas rubra]